jgi:hypothetical protein
MTHRKLNNPKHSAYNVEVAKAYFKVLRMTKQIVAKLDSYEARCTLTQKQKDTYSNIRIHQFVSPLFYLSLEVGCYDKLYIHFGYEQFDVDHDLVGLSSKFVRTLYKYTSASKTELNIEDCVHANYIITTCSELYEAIESSAHHKHTFKAIPFKPKVVRRKVMLAVA